MTISVVQTQTGNALGTSVTATYSPAATAGNLLVAALFTKSDTGWGNPANWLTAGSVHNATNADDLVLAYRLQAVGGETGITFAINSSDQSTLVIWEVSGRGPFALGNVGAGSAFVTGVTSIGSSSTGVLLLPSQICFACAGLRNVAITNPAVDSSFVPNPPTDANDSSTGVVNTLAATKIVNSTVAQSCNFSWLIAADAMGLIATFSEAVPSAVGKLVMPIPLW